MHIFAFTIKPSESCRTCDHVVTVIEVESNNRRSLGCARPKRPTAGVGFLGKVRELTQFSPAGSLWAPLMGSGRTTHVYGQGPRSHGVQGVSWPPTFLGAGSTCGCGPPLLWGSVGAWMLLTTHVSCQTSWYVIENAIKTRFWAVR